MTAASDAARQQATDAAVGAFARQLAASRELLPTLYPETPGFVMPPVSDEAAYMRMATELLTKKKTTVTGTNGKAITISMDDSDPDNADHLDARDTKAGGLFKRSLGVDNLNNLATAGGISDFADAIGEAVEKNSSNNGWLRGATFGNVIEGFFRWIMGLLSGESTGGLAQTIATVTAENIHSDTKENLQRLRGERPEMAAMLSDKAIDQAANGAYYATLEKAGFASPDAPKATTFADVVPITFDGVKVNEMRNQLYSEILTPPTGPDLGEQIGAALVEKKRSGFWSNNFGWAKGVSEEGLKKGAKNMANVIAATIADKATDTATAKTLSGMSKEEYANYMANEVTTALKAQERRLDLPMKLTDERMAEFTARTRESILKNYDRLSMVTRLAASGQQPPLALDSEAVRDAGKMALSAGTSQGIEADVMAQAGSKLGGTRTL